jgi:hypothetical protein
MDPATDPAIFAFGLDLQAANKKRPVFFSFSAYYFLEVSGPLTNKSGSGSRRPKNIRIHNTERATKQQSTGYVCSVKATKSICDLSH